MTGKGDGVSLSAPKGASRRKFFTRTGRIAATLAMTPALPAFSADSSSSQAEEASESQGPSERTTAAFRLRVQAAKSDLLILPAKNQANGDEVLYKDKGGTYTKGLPHDAWGRVDSAAYASFQTALASGEFADFENVPLGGTRPLNGPLGGLAFDLAALDNVQFGQPEVPPAPPIASDQSATELLEHYWAALLRDLPFSDYTNDSLAGEAAAELSGLPTYLGPRNEQGQVTPDLLFRGSFAGESEGPYVSQLMVRPTVSGAQPISQQLVTYLPGIDYLTTFSEWLKVQNGGSTGLQNQNDPVLRYLRNGRDLAAYTHADVLYSPYLNAYLVLAGMRAPLQPGNPYRTSARQTGAGTFGVADIAGTLAEVATKTLNAVWYQKWFVHLRTRPEGAGGLVELMKSGQGDKTEVAMSNVLLHSLGLQRSLQRYGNCLLSQAYPEGSPVHPSYPTGHGAVGGACITALKFFFDGGFVVPNPVIPARDGLSLLDYTTTDAGRLTVNGELNKLGHNISFGHGLHAGIHWRSDSDTSLLLGEAVALSYLRNKAKIYRESFSVELTKFDGSTVSISNRES